MANKLRCSSCREFFQRENIWRTDGIQSFCSYICFAKKKKGPARKSKKSISPQLRRQVQERDRSQCRMCRSTVSELHHVIYRSEGGENLAGNLISLCRYCHERVHSNKGVFQSILVDILESDYWVTPEEIEARAMERFDVIDKEYDGKSLLCGLCEVPYQISSTPRSGPCCLLFLQASAD